MPARVSADNCCPVISWSARGLKYDFEYCRILFQSLELRLRLPIMLETARTKELTGQRSSRWCTHPPLWLTEAADATCAGNPWAKKLRPGTHSQPLRSSASGLPDDSTRMAAAQPLGGLTKTHWCNGVQPSAFARAKLAPLRPYLCGQPGGVTLLVMSTDRWKSQAIDLATAAERFTLNARNL